MPRCRRSPIAAMAAGALLAAGLIAAGAATSAPSTPVIPSIGSVPGSATARFNVSVEGAATASKDEDWGAPAPCMVSVHSSTRERTTFQRGRGMVLEFRRIGKGPRAPIIVQRPGRRLDTSLVLTVKVTRTADGSATRADPPGAPVSICQPVVEDLAQGPDCGKPQVEKANAALLYTRPRPGMGLLRVQLNRLLPLSEIECPVSEVRPGIDFMKFGWPTPVMRNELKVSIPPHQIFGTKRVIVGRLASGLISTGPVAAAIGALTGTVTNFGSTTLTVRLIRVR